MSKLLSDNLKNNILVHYYHDHTNIDPLSDYLRVIFLKLKDQVTNNINNNNVINVTDMLSDDRSTINFNDISGHLKKDKHNILIFNRLSAIRAYNTDFIYKMHQYLFDDSITVLWFCGWIDNAVPLLMIKAASNNIYLRIRPNLGITKIDKCLNEIDESYLTYVKDTVNTAIFIHITQTQQRGVISFSQLK